MTNAILPTGGEDGTGVVPTSADVTHKGTTVGQVSEGDRVTISATHQVRIDGMDSWIKVEINSAVREGEDGKAAIGRVGKVIAANIVNEITRQAEVIVEANKGQRQPY